MNPSQLYIGKSKSRARYMVRHYVRFGNGMAFEWLMTPYDKELSRMWQAAFARAAATSLIRMAEYLEDWKP